MALAGKPPARPRLSTSADTQIEPREALAMSVPVNLPALGESVTEGTVTRWLKQVGDTVAADEPLVEVSTDKVDTEIPAPAGGVLLEITAPEDSVVEVGGVLAVIGEAGEAPSGAATRRPRPHGSGRPARTCGTRGTGRGAGRRFPAAAFRALRRHGATGFRSTRGPPGTGGSRCSPAPAAPAAVAPAPAAPAHAAPPASGSGGGDTSGAAATEVLLPALGESVTEGTVTRWLKQVGDEVTVDEPLLEVSTDKVDTEIPAPVAGTLLEVRVAEDETADVGSVLALIGPAGAAPAPAPPLLHPLRPLLLHNLRLRRRPQPRPPPPRQPHPLRRQHHQLPRQRRPGARAAAVPVAAAADLAAPAASGRVPYVTPWSASWRRKGVDLATVAGTGRGGRIRKEDVVAAAASRSAASGTAAAAAALPLLVRSEAPQPSPPPRRPRPHGRCWRSRRCGNHGEDQPTAAGHRRSHGGVAAGFRAADVGGRGRRHPRGPAPGRQQGRLPREVRRKPVVPALLRRGRGGGLARLPDGQCQPRSGSRHGDLPRRRAPRIAVDTERGCSFP